VKKEETNDIVQFLIPSLNALDISTSHMKIDVTTEKSGNKRGDIWISLKPLTDKDFEKTIIALIEAKHKNTTLGDMDWRDAMRQGKEKAPRQGLNYYIVTNCKTENRFYSAYNEEEIQVDGQILTKLVAFEVLQKINSQVSADNSYVIHKAPRIIQPLSESRFRNTLKHLADLYRSAGLKRGDERIDITVSLVVLKYIWEQEQEKRTLDVAITLWGDLKDIAYDNKPGDLGAEFMKMSNLIWYSAYKDNMYKDFRDIVPLTSALTNEHYKKIYRALDQYHFHGANFDLFGAIYEEFASQQKKREFGEFYTRRHITGMVARRLLRDEKHPTSILVCDPACGTGGFLTEAFKTLMTNYSYSKQLNVEAEKQLKENTFWGYDNDSKSVARAKLNMFFVGDGHMHIYKTQDSLLGWVKSIGWELERFDYIMTNPPMGPYGGPANINDFDFTNEKRGEFLFTEMVVKATKLGGQIAIVLNDGALESPSRERFRKALLEACDIYAFVSLTKFAFAPYTKEKTYIIFMQKKQSHEQSKFQTFPIWHYILDYDGYANSDKRYRTKYHDDLLEMEELFSDAVALARMYDIDKKAFNAQRGAFEREVNAQERREGLNGMKCGYVEMDRVSKANFFNLLSEFYLRPYIAQRITETEFGIRLNNIQESIRNLQGYIEYLGLHNDSQ